MIAALVQALVLGFMIAGTHGWLVRGVKPNTTDYVSFWAAGRLADRGQAPLAYDHAAHLRVEEAATAPGIGYQYFFNPPPYLLVMAPLAWLPYLVSFVVFAGASLCLWLAVGTRVAGGGATATLCLMAVPSLWWVLGLGQNSFLSASLIGGGLLALPHRKILAGIAFGLLCYKPHLGLLIPVALAAGGEWAAIAAAGLTVAGAVALTTALFGPSVWRAYLDTFTRDLSGPINGGAVLLAARVDSTGAAQEMGLGLGAAHAVWGLCLAATLFCVWVSWRPVRGRGPDQDNHAIRGAVLAAGVLLAAPFALFYDLIMCSLAAAWLARAARRDGWLPGEGVSLIVLCVFNLLAAAIVVHAVRVPFGALVAPVLLVLAMRRGGWLGGFGSPPGRRWLAPSTRASRKKAQVNALVKTFIASSTIKV